MVCAACCFRKYAILHSHYLALELFVNTFCGQREEQQQVADSTSLYLCVCSSPHFACRRHPKSVVLKFYTEKKTAAGAELHSPVATYYLINSRGIESWCGRDFPHLSRMALRPTQPPVHLVPSFVQGIKDAAARS